MTIIDKRATDIDARFRSLLQKAVRRGNVDLVYTVSALIESLTSREKNWFRNRTVIITVEECWPLVGELVFNKNFHSKAAALIKVTRSLKSREAAGLGYLSYRLFEGDTSVLDGSTDDRHIKIIANAVHRPDDFWHWLDRNVGAEEPRLLIDNARRFRNAGRPLDRVVVQAAAYLAAFGQWPEVRPVEGAEESFPYWVALDGHTPQGKRALNDVARDLHMDLKQLEWVFFFFEGSVANGSLPSRWWQRNCAWQFQRLGLPGEEAHLLWEPARPQVAEALFEDSRRLHREIYTWKLANLQRIEALKKQVELFTQRFESGHIDQLELF